VLVKGNKGGKEMTNGDLKNQLHESAKWLKEEKRHEEEFLKRLRNFHGSLKTQGFQPLDSFYRLIKEWEQRASTIDQAIGEIESYLQKG
jgi:hypothetical protein